MNLKRGVAYFLAAVSLGMLAYATVAQANADPSDTQSEVIVIGQNGTGSGFFVDPTHIVTAAHVIVEGEKPDATFKVQLDDGARQDATVVQVDTVNDIAVLSVATKSLHVSRVHCSGPVVGQSIMSRGQPITLGIISTWGRIASATDTARGPWPHSIIGNVVIAPGNSGGPVYNDQGDVEGMSVGMPNFMTSPISMSAMPVDIIVPARQICDDMVKWGLHL